jgi:hypothetical protein
VVNELRLCQSNNTVKYEESPKKAQSNAVRMSDDTSGLNLFVDMLLLHSYRPTHNEKVESGSKTQLSPFSHRFAATIHEMLLTMWHLDRDAQTFVRLLNHLRQATMLT